MEITHRPTADAAAQEWLHAVTMLTATQPGGYARTSAGGIAEIVSGVPLPTLNGVFGIARDPDPAGFAEAAASHRLSGVPWSIQVRGDDVDPAIVRTAASHGLEHRVALPFMLRELTAADVAPVPASRRVTSAGELAYRRALAAGFEAPESLFATIAAPEVLDHPSMSAYLIEVDGEPVATSFGVLSGDMVGVFNVSVPPGRRGRGHGRAATGAVLHDAYAAGARVAYLHSSAAGLPLYRSMGFRTAENWSVFS
ncbi:acetyltransferase [Actinoplanes sp. NBRC 14428]|uniref:Acetyltransferase (GNAT) family protein n=1 Tax=Pseudosporangium ferrugineum TaxID=439699 RepID=A0A2T0SII8_9ACTN|nr:GNAT family N-acetyltransferase [Pseudosporangium ferrugineum]PRY33221.1 acetyltransferase (GNAT) family protein [Pseudosporangium ferrugineum]BCJ48786.1 acetyltransferase [Actinoplanes sp. NBRC 14428]